MNPLLPGHSGTTPKPSRHALNTSQGTNEDDSQNDPRPEAGLFHGQMTQNSGPEERHDRQMFFISFNPYVYNQRLFQHHQDYRQIFALYFSPTFSEKIQNFGSYEDS